MNKKYDELSNEEKMALIEICKKDFIIFVETILNVELTDAQKILLREIYKSSKKQDKPNYTCQVLCEPVHKTYGKSTGLVMMDKLLMDEMKEGNE